MAASDRSSMRVAIGRPGVVLSRASAARRTLRLVFHTPGGTGYVWLRDGSLEEATFGRFTGESALVEVLSYACARWTEEPNVNVDHRRLDMKLSALARTSDVRCERRAELLARVPPLSSILEREPRSRPLQDGPERRVFDLIDGHRPLLSILDESGLPPGLALDSIAKLVDAGAVRCLGVTWLAEEEAAAQTAVDDTAVNALAAELGAAPGGQRTQLAEGTHDGRAPVVGRYEILSRLGRGGMATVYLCRVRGDGGFSRRFAMKVLREELCRNKEVVQLLFSEARLTSLLHHPNVVSVVDVGNYRGQPYLVMEYVPGCSVGELLEIDARGDVALTSAAAAAIAVEALSGLYAAHTLCDDRGRPLGLVHQDVSPENLLVGYDGVTRVTDFGVARAGDALDAAVQNRGKPHYLAPERATSGQVDHRSDIFALGVVLYRMLTGMDLFEGDSVEDIVQQVLYKPVPPPSTVGRRPHPAFDGVCLRALERQPERRYQSAEHFRGDLLRTAVMIDEYALGSEVAALAQSVAKVTAKPPAAYQHAQANASDREARDPSPNARAIVLTRPPQPSSQEALRKTQVLPTLKPRKAPTEWVVLIFLFVALGGALVLDAFSESEPEPTTLPREARETEDRFFLEGPDLKVNLESDDDLPSSPEEAGADGSEDEQPSLGDADLGGDP